MYEVGDALDGGCVVPAEADPVEGSDSAEKITWDSNCNDNLGKPSHLLPVNRRKRVV